MSTTDQTDPNNELPAPVPYNNQYAPSFPFGIAANSSSISSANAFQPLPSSTVIVSPMYAVLARLICGDQDVLIIGHRVVVGRARQNNAVDFQVARDTLISRKHFILHYSNGVFAVEVLSKNGVYLDKLFLPQSELPYMLPKSCVFKFPNTSTTVFFENLVERAANDGVVMVMNGPAPPSAEAMDLSCKIQHTEDASANDVVPQDNANCNKHVDNNLTIGSDIMTLIDKLLLAANVKSEPPANNCKKVDIPDVPLDCTGSGSPIISEEHQLEALPEASENESSASYVPTESIETAKPPYSYAQLIIQAITASPQQQCTLPEIYAYLRANYPFFRQRRQDGWQNSIRHNLSLNRYFIKVPRMTDVAAKGCYWRIDPTCYASLKKKRFQKRLQWRIRAAKAECRSAPVSPYTSDDSNGEPALLPVSAPGSPAQTSSTAQDNGYKQYVRTWRNFAIRDRASVGKRLQL
ncbi:forkhead box protein K2-like [Anopheles merus]|uniref:forkhead box protein K2-like n=1 Tax=Anopheles merus TaxID=30066 RepID=UPI001BE3EBAE|nr:forkhead box protein K2-like [Anopheles merus]XP_041771762.1 forkhead box protein K2-like [Anopheles merus]